MSRSAACARRGVNVSGRRTLRWVHAARWPRTVLFGPAPCKAPSVQGLSPFLARDPIEWVASNAFAFALLDRFPVSPGHTLVIPRRLVATWFEATSEEQKALLELVTQVKLRLDEERHPDGFNVGINVGEAAGQTVMHLHVHVIPRYCGDMDDPRGGVRGVIPAKQNYGAASTAPAQSAHPFACLPRFVHGEDDHFGGTRARHRPSMAMGKTAMPTCRPSGARPFPERAPAVGGNVRRWRSSERCFLKGARALSTRCVPS